MGSRVSFLIRKEFLQLLRDRMMLSMILMMPVVQIIMFGYAATTDVKDIHLVVRDADRTPISRRLTRSFVNSGYFQRVANVPREQDLARALDSGAASIALNIDPGLQNRFKSARPANVQIIVDGSNSNQASIAMAYATQIAARFGAPEVLTRKGSAPGLPSVQTAVRLRYNPDATSVNYMVPSLLAIILMIGTMSNTSQAVVREADRGTLEQLIVTPVKRWELVLGKIVPYALVGLVQMTAILLIGLFWFHVPFRGSLALLYGVALIFLLASLGQGLFISTVSRTRQQAIMATMMFTMPAMMLSGFIFPVENMPRLMYYISFLIPMRYFLEATRAIFLKGSGVVDLWSQILLLAGYSVAIFWLSVARFHKKLG